MESRDHSLEPAVAEARSRELELQVEQRTAELEREIDHRLQIEKSLRQSEREQAITTERNRLARELHDSVTHSLFLSAALAETLPRVWEQNPERARQAMADLQDLTRGALSEMRTMLLELRPEALAEQRLELLLRQLTDGMMARTKMDVITTLEGDYPLPNDVKIGLYRITQEALTNIAKHAQANRSIVNLRCEPKQVVLCIRDNGIGFDPESTKPGSMGLDIMRERSQTIGASFELESEPGSGTEITVTWVDNSNTIAGAQYETEKPSG